MHIWLQFRCYIWVLGFQPHLFPLKQTELCNYCKWTWQGHYYTHW